jgi:small subunit ribosomal protein S4
MAKDSKSRCVRCRREGEKLFLKGERCNTAKCALARRSYPPGMHGPKGKARLTGYGVQLREKQKARRIYNILEKQFKNYFLKASKKKGDTSEFLLQLLEMQLDNVVYRLGFARSRQQARQIVNHGLLLVNNKKIDIPSYQVKVGETISIKPSMLAKSLFQNLPQNLKKHETPNWVSLDINKIEGKILGKPKKDDIKTQFDPKLIVEFYSR